jgi:ABC-type lipoprotein release transport system permease subunit
MTFQLAWRNVWRNPRRTAVIMMAVIVGVWSMVTLGALMRGIAEQMVENGIATLTGHVMVQQAGYPDDPVVENSIARPQALAAALKAGLPTDARWCGRIRVEAVASNARHSSGVTLVGIDPEAEAPVSFIGTAVTEGRYLAGNDRRGIVVGRALADTFGTGIGKKLVLMSRDTTGEIASRAFRIVGLYDSELDATEKQFVFVPRQAADGMLTLDGALSEISIRLPERRQAAETARRLQAALEGTGLVVRDWPRLLPLLNSYLELYDGFVYLWYLAVFIAMGFGIVNTTLMAVYERMREFGLLKALGMKPLGIVTGVLVEVGTILIIGVIAGNLLGAASVAWLGRTGIDLSAMAAGSEYVGMGRVIHPLMAAKDMVAANLVVLVLGLLVSLYPAIKAARIVPVEAMAYE